MDYKAQLEAMSLRLGSWEQISVREGKDGTYSAWFLLCNFPIVQMAALIAELSSEPQKAMADNERNSGMYTRGGTPRMEILVAGIPADKAMQFKAAVETVTAETVARRERELEAIRGPRGAA
jgi:hypothetical protein